MADLSTSERILAAMRAGRTIVLVRSQALLKTGRKPIVTVYAAKEAADG